MILGSWQNTGEGMASGDFALAKVLRAPGVAGLRSGPWLGSEVSRGSGELCRSGLISEGQIREGRS